jgi:hypothetical protein
MPQVFHCPTPSHIVAFLKAHEQLIEACDVLVIDDAWHMVSQADPQRPLSHAALFSALSSAAAQYRVCVYIAGRAKSQINPGESLLASVFGDGIHTSSLAHRMIILRARGSAQRRLLKIRGKTIAVEIQENGMIPSPHV